jgi:hypothetical protein
MLFTSHLENGLTHTGVVKDLGILVDDICTFREHRAKAIKKAKQKAS